METVAPSASLHNTSGLLVNDFDLVVHYHIVDILLEHRVCLQELVDRMYPFRLQSELSHYLILLQLLLLGGKTALLHFSHRASHIRDDEEF